MNRIKIAPHLDVETLEAGYRGSTDAISRSHWQILWLLVRDETTGRVSAMTGYSVPWIRALVKRYNAEGEAAVGDQRHRNAGQAQLLNARQQAQLRKILLAATERGERWTGRQVAAWMSQQLGRLVGKQRGYEVLQRLQMSLQVPRPAHQDADEGEQNRFKKTIPIGWIVWRAVDAIAVLFRKSGQWTNTGSDYSLFCAGSGHHAANVPSIGYVRVTNGSISTGLCIRVRDARFGC